MNQSVSQIPYGLRLFNFKAEGYTAEMSAVLAIDQGTTGSTALVISRQGKVLGTCLLRIHSILSKAWLG